MPYIIVKGAKELQKKLEKTQKQIKFATSLAINKTAKRIKEAEQGHMKQVFDRPTRFTLNSLFIKPSTKHNLQAKVWLKDFAHKGTAATKYLGPQVKGGGRNYKKFEWLLQRRGLLPKGMYLVPGAGAKLNSFGNITKGQIQKVISSLGAQFDSAQNTSKRSKKIYFAARINGTYAIWLRTTTGIKPYMVAVRAPKYAKRFDFYGVAGKVVDRHFKKEMAKALDYALKTAR